MAYGNGGETGGAIHQAQQWSGPRDVAVPVNSVAGELDATDKRLALLHESISALENRLNPILRPASSQTNTAGGSGTTPTPSASLVVSALRAAGYQHDAAVARLHDLLDRIEL